MHVNLMLESSQETSGITLLRFEITRYPLQTRESFLPRETFYLSAPSEFTLPFLPACMSCPRDAEYPCKFSQN